MVEQLIRDQNHVPVAGGVSSASATTVLPFTINSSNGRLLVDNAGGGTGTVTDVSVVTANGFAGTVADSTTTPAITLTTTVNAPALAGNGTAISAATTTGSGSTVVLATDPTFPASITVGAAAGVTGDILLKGTTSGTVTLTVADAAGTWTLQLPDNDGSSGQVLTTNGSGVTTWETPAGGGNVSNTGTPANNQIAIWTDATTIEGVAGLTFDGTTLATTALTVDNITIDLNTISSTSGNLNITPVAGSAIVLDGTISVDAGVVTGITSLGVTGTRVTAGFFTDLTVTNAISGSVTGNAGTASAVALGGITGLGTGVATALAINVGSVGAFVTFNGALGTPSSGTVTNLTGTASININGTVGATTPTTGVFTTLVAGSTTSLLLGTAGSAVGNIGFRNATSGTITLAPATGALGTVTLTLPARTDTLVTLGGTETLTAKTLTSPAITTGTYSGTQLLAEGASIGLDPALSADGTYTGVTITGTAGATLAFGDVIYLAVADSRWELADADAVSTGGSVLIGMCVQAAAADGDPTTILMFGNIRADAAFPTLTIGSAVYLSTTAGDITQTVLSGTDDVVIVLGKPLTADSMMFISPMDWATYV